MEWQTDLLSSIKSSICHYFSEISSEKVCQWVRHHGEHHGLYGDLSVPWDIRPLQQHVSVLENGKHVCHCVCEGHGECHSIICYKLLKCLKGRENGGNHERDCETDLVLQDLIRQSKGWCLHIAHCRVRHSRLWMFLERPHTFTVVLHHILSHGETYGLLPRKHQRAVVSSDVADDLNAMDLSEFRALAICGVLRRLLMAHGYDIVDASAVPEPCMHVCVRLKSSSPTPPTAVQVACGIVVGKGSMSVERKVLARDYISQRRGQLEMLAFARHGDDDDVADTKRSCALATQCEASVRVELLYVRPSRCATVSLSGSAADGAETGKKERADFFLYNCARIAALLSQYEKAVMSGEYPPLPPLEDVDFSLLTKEEEWVLVFGHLLAFPGVVRSCLDDLAQGRPRPNLLCHFLGHLCGHYSVYYHYVRLLTEPTPHLLPTMYARLYLLRAIQVVLHSLLRLLDIEPVTHM